jgi:lysozyme
MKMYDLVLEIIVLLKKEEGLQLKRFRDANRWAIGYGRQCRADQKPITKEKAELWLLQDALYALNAVDEVPDLTPHQRIALTSLVFNIGVGAWQESTIRKLLMKGDVKGASEEFKRWVYVRENGEPKVSPTLEGRRGREKIIFDAHEWSAFAGGDFLGFVDALDKPGAEQEARKKFNVPADTPVLIYHF